MLMRKVNAILSLIATFLLLDHAIFLSVWMLTKGTIAQSAGFLPWILCGVVLVHAVISIGLGIAAHKGAEHTKVKQYKKWNRSTIFQRISGVLLVVFIPLHVAGAAGAIHPPKVVHAIVPLLFFTVSLAHAAVSTSKAFVTLGIGSARIVKVADRVIKVVCAATLVASLVGFYLNIV